MKFLIIRNKSNSKAVDASLILLTYLSSQGFEADIMDSDLTCSCLDDAPWDGFDAHEYDLVISLGGDGTLINAAHVLKGSRIPILPINFGHLGFMVNSPDDGVVAMVANALCGDVTQEERSCLKIEFYRDEEYVGERFALNEVSVSRGHHGRIISYSVDVSGQHLFNLRGDGLVVSTATGSTAYALSAGGPLVSPNHKGMVIVPLAPHSLVSRAVVTDSSDFVEIDVSSNDSWREVSYFIDGELLTFSEPASRVVVSRYEDPVVLLRYKAPGFYNLVSQTFFDGVR